MGAEGARRSVLAFELWKETGGFCFCRRPGRPGPFDAAAAAAAAALRSSAWPKLLSITHVACTQLRTAIRIPRDGRPWRGARGTAVLPLAAYEDGGSAVRARKGQYAGTSEDLLAKRAALQGCVHQRPLAKPSPGRATLLRRPLALVLSLLPDFRFHRSPLSHVVDTPGTGKRLYCPSQLTFQRWVHCISTSK